MYLQARFKCLILKICGSKTLLAIESMLFDSQSEIGEVDFIHYLFLSKEGGGGGQGG